MISGVDLELTETSPAAPPNGATGTPPTPALFTAQSHCSVSTRPAVKRTGLFQSARDEVNKMAQLRV